MKKYSLFLIILISVSFASNVSMFLVCNQQLNIPANFKSMLIQKLQTELSRFYNVVSDEEVQNYIKKLKITYNYNDFSTLVSKFPISDFGLIFSIDDFKKESKDEKVVSFYRSLTGSYAFIKGQYVKVSNKRLYSYNDRTKSYYYDPKEGIYIRYSYPWSRSDDEEYFLTYGVFYSKRVDYKHEQRYVFGGTYRLVDFSKGIIVRSGNIQSNGDNFNSLLAFNIDLKDLKYYDEKPKILVYSVTNENDYLKRKVESYIESQKRFVSVDRKDIEKIMKQKKLGLSFSNLSKDFTELKIARYFIGIKLNYENTEKVSQSETEFYSDPFRGNYVDGVEVEVGKYYKKVGKEYVLDRKNGQYVKKAKGAWNKKDDYINIFGKSFQSAKTVRNTYYKAYANLSYVIYDGNSVEVIDSKNYNLSVSLPFSVVDPLYGSVASSYPSDVYSSLFSNIDKEIYSKLKRNFAIKTEVVNSKNRDLILGAGNNYGVDKNSIFKVYGKGSVFLNGKLKDYNFDMGFARVTNVNNEDSEALLINLKKYSRYPNSGDLAIEDFDYFPKFPFSFSVSLLNYETPTIEFGINLLQRNIYSETLSKINIFYISNGDMGARYFLKLSPNLSTGLGFIKSENYGFGGILSLNLEDFAFIQTNVGIFTTKRNINFEIGF